MPTQEVTYKKQNGSHGLTLDESQREVVIAIVSTGGALESAAKYVNSTVDVIRRTIEKYSDFRQRVRRAEATLEIANLRSIQTEAQEDFRAAAWLLERLVPERFDLKHPSRVTTAQVADLMAAISELIAEEVPAPEDRQRILARMQALTDELDYGITTEHDES
jgi:hypothetical protein